MGSLAGGLQRREAAARAEAEQLRGGRSRGCLSVWPGSRSSCRVRDGRGRDHADSGIALDWLGAGRESRAWT